MIDDINIYSKKFGTGRYYPVVRIPKSIRDILEKYPYYYRPKPVPPYRPTQPSLYNINITRRAFDTWFNSLPKSDSNIFKLYANTKDFNMEGLDIAKTTPFKNYCWFLGIVVFYVFMVGGTGIPAFVFGAFLVLVLVSMVWIPIIIIPIKKKEKYNNESSKKRLTQYLADLKDYIIRLETYKIAWDKYEKDLHEYNDAIQQKKRNPIIEKIRQNAYEKVNRAISFRELTYDEISNVKKGRAECLFYNEMLNYYTHDFPFDIYINVKIESTQDKGNVYFPDFLLCSNDGKIKNIYYDIEIDEPYVQSTGEPIHCEDMDCSRDDFFSDNDIIVIRFAESQIFQYPYACARYIIELHKNIISMSDRPKLVRCGFKVERWSRELSIEWSKIHYRDTYTPSILYFDHYNLTYNNDNWRLISTSQLDKKDIEEISEIKAVRWYSKKCLLISMKSGEQRYIDINPGHPFHEGEDVETIDLRIETYINKNNERMYLVGHYIDETFINTHFKTVNTNATKGQKDIEIKTSPSLD